MKAATVRARVDEGLKTDVEKVLRKLGLSFSEAIVLYLSQIRLRKGIPFEIALPNKKTLKTLKDTDANKNLARYKNAKKMFDKLGV